MMFLEEVFQTMTKHWQLLIGAVIVLVALFLPRGVAGLLPTWHLRRAKAEPTQRAPGQTHA